MNNSKIMKVKNHLLRYGCISSWQAITEYRATRLSAIIFDLRKEGMNIENEWQHNESSRWVMYRLVEI